MKQSGFTLAEIGIGAAVISAVMISGFIFYNNMIASSQAHSVYNHAKEVANEMLNFHARTEALPSTSGYITGNTGPDQVAAIEEALWINGDPSGITGHVWIKLAADNIQASLANKSICFHYERTANLSNVSYIGCTTTIDGGAYNGSPLAIGQKSPILPECTISDSCIDSTTQAYGPDENIYGSGCNYDPNSQGGYVNAPGMTCDMFALGCSWYETYGAGDGSHSCLCVNSSGTYYEWDTATHAVTTTPSTYCNDPNNQP
jgi:Tfp pilus assembly protein FimT